MQSESSAESPLDIKQLRGRLVLLLSCACIENELRNNLIQIVDGELAPRRSCARTALLIQPSLEKNGDLCQYVVSPSDVIIWRHLQEKLAILK